MEPGTKIVPEALGLISGCRMTTALRNCPDRAAGYQVGDEIRGEDPLDPQEEIDRSRQCWAYHQSQMGCDEAESGCPRPRRLRYNVREEHHLGGVKVLR